MLTRFCPNCEREMEVKRFDGEDYSLLVCASCGMGLGLAVGERPAVSAVTFKSSKSVFEAPAASPPSVATHQKTRENSRADPPASSLEPASKMMRCVLLVDPDDAFRAMAKMRILDRHCAKEVFEMATPGRAIEQMMSIAIEGSRPDLVICDLNLDEMSGLELAHAIRAIEKGLDCSTTPLLFLTSAPLTDALKAEMKSLGRVRYVRKPEGDPQRVSEKLISLFDRLLEPSKA